MSDIFIRIDRPSQNIIVTSGGTVSTINDQRSLVRVQPYGNVTINAGESVSSLNASYTAGEAITAYQVVALVDGLVVPASTDNSAHTSSVLGIARETVTAGQPIQVVTDGIISNPTWSWADDQPLFLGLEGQILTQPDFNQVFIIQLGDAPSPTQINVSLDKPTLL